MFLQKEQIPELVPRIFTARIRAQLLFQLENCQKLDLEQPCETHLTCKKTN